MIYNSIFKDDDFKRISAKYNVPSSLDWFALGYCIANSASNIGWEDVIIYDGVAMESFIGGLKTNTVCGASDILTLCDNNKDARYPLLELSSLVDFRVLQLFNLILPS